MCHVCYYTTLNPAIARTQHQAERYMRSHLLPHHSSLPTLSPCQLESPLTTMAAVPEGRSRVNDLAMPSLSPGKANCHTTDGPNKTRQEKCEKKQVVLKTSTPSMPPMIPKKNLNRKETRAPESPYRDALNPIRRIRIHCIGGGNVTHGQPNRNIDSEQWDSLRCHVLCFLRVDHLRGNSLPHSLTVQSHLLPRSTEKVHNCLHPPSHLRFHPRRSLQETITVPFTSSIWVPPR